MRMTPYLYFRGNCEAALTFYAASGLGRISQLQRYEGTPMADRDGGAWREKVLHCLFEGEGLRLFASDGADSEPMKGCALLIEFEDPGAAGACFATLSEGGCVTVAFARQFWGDWYGNFTDRFGVQWAILGRAAS